ncbi:glycosyltransferase family 4 protein [Flindersiella endophytica]
MVLRPLLEARRVRRSLFSSAARERSLTVLDPALVARAKPPTLRVAHFVDTYLPRRDGIVTSLQALAEAMGELGHESLIVVPRHPDQPDDDRLLRLPSLPCGVAQFRLAPWPRNKHVEQIAHWLPHVIHVHTPFTVGLLGILAARRLGLPLVQTYHTDLHGYAQAYRLPAPALEAVTRCYAMRLSSPKPELPRGVPRAERRDKIVDACNEVLYGEADAVLVPTPAILTRRKLPVEDDRIYLAPSGVSLPKVPASARMSFRARHGIGADEPAVLFVGRVNHEKGIPLLTEAFGRVLRAVPNARLVLVGAVYEQRWVTGLLDRAGISGRTVLVGQVPPEQVAEAYAACDLFAFPSLTDTQGLVVQEAALAGLPAVLADPALHASGPLAGASVLGGATAEGFAAAITELLTTPERRVELGRAAQAMAEQNTPATFARRMEQVYAQAVRRGASAVRLSREGRRIPFRSRRAIA